MYIEPYAAIQEPGTSQIRMARENFSNNTTNPVTMSFYDNISQVFEMEKMRYY